MVHADAPSYELGEVFAEGGGEAEGAYFLGDELFFFRRNEPRQRG